jgi:hypothetical protein
VTLERICLDLGRDLQLRVRGFNHLSNACLAEVEVHGNRAYRGAECVCFSDVLVALAGHRVKLHEVDPTAACDGFPAHLSAESILLGLGAQDGVSSLVVHAWAA